MLNRITFLTAGESHGKGLLGIIDGIPSHLEISEEYIAYQSILGHDFSLNIGESVPKLTDYHDEFVAN